MSLVDRWTVTDGATRGASDCLFVDAGGRGTDFSRPLSSASAT
ncbi:hypothetical protein [Halorientalis sp.]|nr:hypothetical protein [Halorientalis sp.]